MNRQRRPRRRAPWIAGIAAFLVVVGAPSAWAYWTAQGSASGTVTTSAVAVSHAGFDTPATTKYLPSSLTATRSFTVTNTSAISGTATATISSPQSYAAKFGVQVWPVANAAACTPSTPVPGSGVSTGTWASTTFSSTLAAGATGTYCARSTIADWRTATDASGGQTVNPVLSVSLNASGWTATAPSTATNAQTTAGMYPLVVGNFFDPTLSSTWFTIRNPTSTSLCLDVSGGGVSASGTSLITWSCHAGANQRWQFAPVSGGDQSLVTIRPRNSPTLRVANDGGTAKAITADSSASQQWYVQQYTGASPFYQLVSKSTGKCLPLGTTSVNVAMVTVDCDDPSAHLSFVREPLTVTSSTSGIFFPTTTVTVSITTLAGQALTLQRFDGANWVAEATIAAGASSTTITQNDLTNNADNTLRIVFGTGTDVAYGPFVLNRSGTTVTVVSGVG